MKSILRIAGASLSLAALAAVSTPVFAHQDRVELRFGNGYDQQPSYVQPDVIYESPAPVYRYQNEDGWRQQQWREQAWRERERERERREHYWQQRNEWRERQWQEQRGREHEGRDDHHDHDRDRNGGWR
jgi:hypothetical protein